MYTLYKFHFLNGISEINQLFDDILIIWPAPVYVCMYVCMYVYVYMYDITLFSLKTITCITIVAMKCRFILHIY